MATEDALVAFLKTRVPGDVDVRPAYTTEEQVRPCVVVHATTTREVNTDAYTLARYIDVEIGIVTAAEEGTLADARTKHYRLVDAVYGVFAQVGVVKAVNSLSPAMVEVWSLYAKTDAGGIGDSAFQSTIAVEIGASPKEV